MGEDDRAWAARRVVERWTEGASARDGAAAQRVAANAELFTQLLAEEPALALVRYEDLVRRARLVLNRVPYTSLALQKLVRAAEPSGQAVTLATLLGEPVPVLRCEARVRGAFTRPGYEQVVKKLLDDPDALLETWVLAREGSDADERLAEAARQLRTRYFEAYIDEWRRFLEAVQIDVPAAGGALPAFQELTRGEPPPLPRLLRAVAYHARLGGVAGAAEKAGEGLLKKMLQRKLGAGANVASAALASDPAARRELGPADVERAMAGLVAFAMPPEPLPGAVAGTPTQPAAPRSMPVDLYQEQLAFIRDALQAARDGAPPGALVERVAAARRRVRSLIETAEVGWRPRLEALLWPPLEAASHASAAESASNASQGWCAAVLQPFQRTLAGRYPFRAEGDDAALSDVAEFYRPGGAVWGFYDQALRADVPRAGEGFQFARQLGGASGYRPELLAFLERARDVTQVLFPGGAAEPKVQLSVRIRPTPGVGRRRPSGGRRARVSSGRRARLQPVGAVREGPRPG
jgi:type VI secretion system protein ImpL